MGSQSGGFGMVSPYFTISAMNIGLLVCHLPYLQLNGTLTLKLSPVFGVGLFCAISICCAASRATWSFARDKAIPFHQIFARISGDASDPSAVPYNAHLLSTIIQLLLGLIYLGSSAAFNAFVGVAVICLGTSYVMPIAILLLNGNGRKEMEGAAFSLGRWGFAINIIALVWVSFEIVLFSMPAVIPVNQVTMNYAIVVFVGFAFFSAVWYFINGRYHYAGPPIPSDIVAEK
ncbi:hypothetical protein H0H93_016559 [Arthromyces matolae]|nr:hypothetical protein H0H93_016559 [Arthromyces matolae]